MSDPMGRFDLETQLKQCKRERTAQAEKQVKLEDSITALTEERVFLISAAQHLYEHLKYWHLRNDSPLSGAINKTSTPCDQIHSRLKEYIHE